MCIRDRRQADLAVQTLHFGACVLDLGLPDGDGMALLARWRARRLNLPVLVLTARSAVPQRVDALRAGADDYVLKPFDPVSYTHLDVYKRQLKAMNHSLSRIVLDVRDGCEGIASASSQIAQGNADLSQRTAEQAASLEQTDASMEQLTSTVQQNASTAGEADKLVTQAAAWAARGGEVVEGVGQTMSQISESSRKIADITLSLIHI